MKTIVSPSLLAADFINLNKDLDMLNRSEADWLHVDIMDGVFVPNISIGFPIVNKLAAHCRKPLDVHYMVIRPERYIDITARSGAMMMTVHQEACTHLHRTIYNIKEAGMKAGVALNPATSIRSIEDVITDLDMVLIMGVNPGFGGQKFIENTIDKVKRLREMIKEAGAKTLIEVDGGVNAETAPRLVEAGVNVLVSGSYVFKAADPLQSIHTLGALRQL